MGSKRGLTDPLGKTENSSLLAWKNTLRNSTDTFDTGMPSFSNSLRRSGSASSLRKSTGNMAASMTGKSSKGNKTLDMERIESEYIKNLQQQVYFLELEASYLREQSKKATDMHPKMTAEAQRMLLKLREMQSEVDRLNTEVKQKETNVAVTANEKERTLARLKQEEGSHQREKRLLVDEIVTLKKEKDLLERDNARKDAQILQARDEVDKTTSMLNTAETKIQIINNQLEQKSEQLKLVQDALDQKRTELLQSDTQLRTVEERYYGSTGAMQEQVVGELREEIRDLRQKLKEAEMSSEHDRFLRNKLTEDSKHLVKENALLNQQVIELQKQAEREKLMRDSEDVRRTHNISELVLAQDREKHLLLEVNQTKELLKCEQDRTTRYLEQAAKQEHLTSTHELRASTTKSRVAELEAWQLKLETENAELQKDKLLLVDHTADLQKQIEEKDTELRELRIRVHTLEARLADLGHLKDLEATLQSQKWDEFSRLAENMKSLSQSMTRTGSTRLEYA